MMAFSAIDNLWKGASGQGVQNLNLMLGLDETEGLSERAVASPSSARAGSRPPAGVEELDPAQLAPGFRAGGAHCGLKGGGETDVGLVVCDAEAVTSAMVLTRNASAAAPIRVCRDESSIAAAIRAAVVNSGNANAETGEQGYADALAMCERAAAALGLDDRAASPSPRPARSACRCRSRPSCAGIDEAAAALAPGGGGAFSDAIITTDRWPKRCTLRAGGVTLSAQAKGAGMIEPNMATMLCFVQTDAVVADPDARLRAAVDASFNRITVDGQMSTNDCVLLQATGASGQPLPRGAAGGGAEAAGDRDRPRRRGRGPGRPDRGQRGGNAGRGRARRPRDRQLAAGEDGAVRPRPQLGPDRPGRRCGAGRRGLEEIGADSIDAAELGAEADGGRDRAAARPRRAPPPTSGSPTSATSTCGSTRNTRRDGPAMTDPP